MMQRTTASAHSLSVQPRSPISNFRATMATGFTAAALLAASLGAHAQDTTAAPAAPPAATQPANDISLSNQKPVKARKADKKEDKVVASKDTKKVAGKLKKDNPLLGQDVKLPDKALYDKAEDAIKHGRFDVGRLDLQTLLNTYPESQFMMRAKLAIADSWYKEGGTAALTQAEQEYKDFITFFPNAPEAAEAQMRVGDIYFREMDKPDRDYTTTTHAEQEYRLMLQQFPDSPLVPQASQRLREVQEVLASRETNIASFYATRTPANYPAAIARFQTVADTYPLYS
ncbi:MAG: outer membrane protein assembly factor BamD, partial [Acidobacteriota bacterium]|nr:outer membrane protein assembly factor BamD [Acidobacteriota bacterium]